MTELNECGRHGWSSTNTSKPCPHCLKEDSKQETIDEIYYHISDLVDDVAILQSALLRVRDEMKDVVSTYKNVNKTTRTGYEVKNGEVKKTEIPF